MAKIGNARPPPDLPLERAFAAKELHGARAGGPPLTIEARRQLESHGAEPPTSTGEDGQAMSCKFEYMVLWSCLDGHWEKLMKPPKTAQEDSRRTCKVPGCSEAPSPEPPGTLKPWRGG